MLPKPYNAGVYKAQRLCLAWRLCGRLCATNRLCGSCGHRIGSAALLAALHTPVTPSWYGASRPAVPIVSTRPRATRADIGRRLAGGSPRARRRKMGVDRRRGWCYCDGQSRARMLTLHERVEFQCGKPTFGKAPQSTLSACPALDTLTSLWTGHLRNRPPVERSAGG